MFNKRLSVVAALVVLGVAACGGGSSTGPTVVYPSPAQGQSGTLTLNQVGTTAGTVTFTATGTLAAADSASAQGSTTALGSPNSTLLYISLSAVGGAATLTAVNTVSINYGSPPPAGNYYVAYWNGSQWVSLKNSPGTISGNVITITGGVLPTAQQSLAQGASDYFVVYTGIVVPPTPVPTASPTPSSTPSSGPANVIVNGDFETGSLAPWTACSYQHLTTGYAAPVSPSPAPAATASQPPTSVGSPSPVLTSDELAPFVSVTPPPPNYNPNYTSDTPSDLGNYAALTGSLSAQINGTTGICQTVTVPAGGMLSFWVYEGGTGYNFYNGDQEAQILDSTGTTILDTLFVELNCYYDSTNFPESPLYATSGCFPSAYGGTSPYTDWQGGFWTERGPYDLSSYAGQSVTLFLGVWTDQTHAGPTSYANFMFVDNVQLTGST